MSETNKRGRDLQAGDEAYTDYEFAGYPGEGGGRKTKVRIVERLDVERGCESGILFRVEPRLRHGTPDSLYDANWFWPITAHQQENRRE